MCLIRCVTALSVLVAFLSLVFRGWCILDLALPQTSLEQAKESTGVAGKIKMMFSGKPEELKLMEELTQLLSELNVRLGLRMRRRYAQHPLLPCGSVAFPCLTSHTRP